MANYDLRLDATEAEMVIDSYRRSRSIQAKQRQFDVALGDRIRRMRRYAELVHRCERPLCALISAIRAYAAKAQKRSSR